MRTTITGNQCSLPFTHNDERAIDCIDIDGKEQCMVADGSFEECSPASKRFFGTQKRSPMSLSLPSDSGFLYRGLQAEIGSPTAGDGDELDDLLKECEEMQRSITAMESAHYAITDELQRASAFPKQIQGAFESVTLRNQEKSGPEEGDKDCFEGVEIFAADGIGARNFRFLVAEDCDCVRRSVLCITESEESFCQIGGAMQEGSKRDPETEPGQTGGSTSMAATSTTPPPADPPFPQLSIRVPDPDPTPTTTTPTTPPARAFDWNKVVEDYYSFEGEVSQGLPLSLTSSAPKLTRIGEEFEVKTIIALGGDQVDGVPVTVTILADHGKANQAEVMGSQGCADGSRSFLLGREVMKSDDKGEVKVHFRFNSAKVGDSNVKITADVPGGSNVVEMSIPVVEKRKTVRVAKSSATQAKEKTDQVQGPQFPQAVPGSNVVEQSAAVGKLLAVVSSNESMPKKKRLRVKTSQQETRSAPAPSSHQTNAPNTQTDGKHADPSAGQTWIPFQGGAMPIGSQHGADLKKKKNVVRVPIPVPVSVSVPQVPVSVPVPVPVPAPVSVPQVPQVLDDRMEVDNDLEFDFTPLPTPMITDADLSVPHAGDKRKASREFAVLAPRGSRKAKRRKVSLAPRQINIQLALTLTGYYWGPVWDYKSQEC
ncbi:hypothetical protein BSKO_04919 [Bryopsis sp. KO-2023]|nr:hypothetical protein BSKO_04919 [Bryopsis sp. KO-2023]